MVEFGEFLNAVVPYVILVVFIFIMYRPLKEPLTALWDFIKSSFSWAGGKKEDAKELFRSKTREIEWS